MIQDLWQPRFINNCSKYPSPWPEKISNSKVPSNFKYIIGLGVLLGYFFRVCGTGGHLSVPLSGWSIPLVKRVIGREHCSDVNQRRGTWVGNILWKRLSGYHLREKQFCLTGFIVFLVEIGPNPSTILLGQGELTPISSSRPLNSTTNSNLTITDKVDNICWNSDDPRATMFTLHWGGDLLWECAHIK